MSLRIKALQAAFWSGGEVFVRQCLGLLISIVLARLIAPEQFGIIALLYLFTGIAGILVDSGFSSALIQRPTITETDKSTVFWINLLLGSIMALIFALSAPLIAAFYELPVLVPLVYVLAFNIFLTAFISIHSTLLSRALDFRTQMKATVFAKAGAGAVGIALALNGFGLWALAAQTIATTVLSLGAFWLLHPWRPKAVFSLASARSMFGFGGYLLAASLLDVVYTRLYTLVLGKFHSVEDVAYYGRAHGTWQLPSTGLSMMLGRVAFPVFSAAGTDPDKLKRGMRVATRSLMFINVPMMIGMALVAEPLILVLFGNQWLAAAPVLQVLCLAGFLWPMHVLNIKALLAQGYSDRMFRVEIWKKVVGVVLIVIGGLYGIIGVAWSQVALSVIAFFINSHYTSRLLSYSWASQLKDISPIIAPGLFMGLGVTLLSHQLVTAAWIELVSLVSLGIILYLGATWVFGSSVLREVSRLIRDLMQSPRIAPPVR